VGGWSTGAINVFQVVTPSSGRVLSQARPAGNETAAAHGSATPAGSRVVELTSQQAALVIDAQLPNGLSGHGSGGGEGLASTTLPSFLPSSGGPVLEAGKGRGWSDNDAGVAARPLPVPEDFSQPVARAAGKEGYQEGMTVLGVQMTDYEAAQDGQTQAATDESADGVGAPAATGETPPQDGARSWLLLPLSWLLTGYNRLTGKSDETRRVNQTTRGRSRGCPR
jgi:hypothetical protein